MNNHQKLLLRLGLIMCSYFSCPFFLNASVIFVNPSAAGANNGTSWVNAFTSLSNALLAAASGDEIWVRYGVYKPVTIVDLNASGGIDAREATFQIPDGAALYGGFTGSEVNREERNWETNLTILSGDIDNNDINLDGNFIAENTGDIVGNNAYHVLYTLNVSATTRVDGFIITAGLAESADVITDANQDGGGWYNNLSGAINASSPAIINSVFHGNYASSEGGALYNKDGSAGGTVLSVIQNCKFNYNKSNVAGGAINLGSFSAGNYQPHIINCVFFMNEAYRRGGAIYFVGDHSKIDSSLFRNNKVTAISMNGTLPGSGGGVNMTGSNAVFEECIFDGNSTTGNPTGPFEGGGGGAVYMSANDPQTTILGASEPKFISCGFYDNLANGNTAAWGGAATHLSDAGILKPKYINCVFSGNQAQNDGGAIANFTRVISAPEGFTSELAPAFTNCTFTANNAGQRGGAIFNDGFVLMGSEILQSRIENSILWNNTATLEGPEVYSTGNNLIAYSLVKGSGGSGGGWNISLGTDGGNNLDVNPEFINEGNPFGVDNIPATNDDGLRLISTSPAVDAGNNSATDLAGINTDYISAPRIQGTRVDMGSYERAGIVIPDINIYWLKNWKDFKPGCLSCPWAFLLFDKVFQQYIWDGPAQLIDKGGTAIITGHIVNLKNKKRGFNVYIKLINKHDWNSWSAKGRTYTAFSLEALLVAKKTHTAWTFWELSNESYLKGTGELSGQISLAHLPANYERGFQLGKGANGLDKDFGMSGTFSYNGKITNKGQTSHLKGIGSMNVDAIACKEDCVPLVNESHPFVQKAQPDNFKVSPDKEVFSVYPVPAHHKLTIASNIKSTGKYTIKIYDITGRLKKQKILSAVNGSFSISVSDLTPGIYVVQLISAFGEMFSKKVIIE